MNIKNVTEYLNKCGYKYISEYDNLNMNYDGHLSIYSSERYIGKIWFAHNGDVILEINGKKTNMNSVEEMTSALYYADRITHQSTKDEPTYYV